VYDEARKETEEGKTIEWGKMAEPEIDDDVQKTEEAVYETLFTNSETCHCDVALKGTLPANGNETPQSRCVPVAPLPERQFTVEGAEPLQVRSSKSQFSNVRLPGSLPILPTVIPLLPTRIQFQIFQFPRTEINPQNQ
jgi:hypothetical protein